MPRILLLPLMLCACGDLETLDCTEIGCSDGVEVFFHRDTFEPGVYTVDLDLHGDLIHCQATIPLDSEPSDGCDDGRVLLMLSGSALEVSEQSVDGLYLAGAEVSAIAVTVAYEDEEIGYAAFEPDQILQPNGPDCEPTCSYASHEMVLDD